MKKWLALVLAAVMMLTVSAACAKTVEPEETEIEHIAGKTVHATVGAYNEEAGTFEVTLYDLDRFEKEDIEKLEAGDILLGNGCVHKVKEVTKDDDGDQLVKTEEGLEIYFVQAGDDDLTARLTDDDRELMHAFAKLILPAAKDLVYEDHSDPEAENPTVYSSLEEILKVKEEKEETSIGFNFYSTQIELNDDLEIVKIHQSFDVAQ